MEHSVDQYIGAALAPIGSTTWKWQRPVRFSSWDSVCCASWALLASFLKVEITSTQVGLLRRI